MKKYILITGGELFNKGAQAMTFIAVDHCKSLFPDHEIIVFSHRDSKRPAEEKRLYSFTFMPFPGFGESLSLITGLRRNHYKKKDRIGYFEMYQEIFKNAIMMLDISGYGIGSNWGIVKSRAYLRRIAVAKHFRIPVYLLPQSFGPFDYKGKHATLMKMEISYYFNYPTMIMAREQESLDCIKKLCKKAHVIKTYDMVLQSQFINADNVYKEKQVFRVHNILPKSVAVIPNSKNNSYGDETENELLYKEIIDSILKEGRPVYLIYHAIEDKEICKRIKRVYYHECEDVRTIDDEMNCIEFEDTVKNFDFVIASRYHSIVHSYKKGIPALIIGWAVKYRELSKVFHQEKYCFDISSVGERKKILHAVGDLSKRHNEESIVIKDVLQTIQSRDVFDLICT